MNYNKDEVLKIVKIALGDTPTGIYISKNEYEWGTSEGVLSSIENRHWVQDFYRDFCGEVQIAKGATKVCLIPEKTDYVIKMNITGQYEGIYEDGETCKECYPEDNEEPIDFQIVKNSSGIDTLKEEIEIFNDAPAELQLLLKPPQFICDYNGIPIYIQEKIASVADDGLGKLKQYSKETIVTARDISASTIPVECEYPIFPLLFITLLVQTYGAEISEAALMAFNESQITDMNGGNYGIDRDGCPCVIDYGGYDDEAFWAQEDDWS